MEFVNGAMQGIKTLVTEMNSATLSGAIDIVVVRQPDGSLKSSPWHVRFGKFNLLFPAEKVVRIKINGKRSTCRMKLGPGGEAFFVVDPPTDGKIVATSPLAVRAERMRLLTDASDDLDTPPQTPNTTTTATATTTITNATATATATTATTVATITATATITAADTSNNTTSNNNTSNNNNTTNPTTPTTTNNTNSNNTPTNNNNTPTATDNNNHNTNDDTTANTTTTTKNNNNNNTTTFDNNTDSNNTTDNTTTTITTNNNNNNNAANNNAANNTNNTDNNATNNNSTTTITNDNPITNDNTADNINDDHSNNTTTTTDNNNNNNTNTNTTNNTTITIDDNNTTNNNDDTTNNDDDTTITIDDTSINDDDDTTTPLTQPTLRSRMRYDSECSAYDSDTRKSSDVEDVSEATSPTTTTAQILSPSVETLAAWDWGSLPQEGGRHIRSRRNSHDDEIDPPFITPLPTPTHTKPTTSMPWRPPQVYLSLCGMDNMEGFDSHIVTLQQYKATANVLTNPKLVVRVNGVAYTWAAAAPLIMGNVVFGAPLTTHDGNDSDTEDIEANHGGTALQSQHGWWPFRTPTSTPTSAAVAVTTTILQPPTVAPPKEQKVSLDQGLSKDDEAALKTHAKSLQLDTEGLKALKLKDGPNEAEFTVLSKMQGRAVVKCVIYLWNHDDNIIISDIDGTITKSDIIGHAANILGRDWNHSGVAKLYTRIEANGYQFLYLTSRSISHAPLTREFINSVTQDGLCLPKGPIMFSPQNFLRSIHREVIARNPQVFKIKCLTSIMELFPERPHGAGPFVAGFGNRHTDEQSYKSVRIRQNRIFTIAPDGVVKVGLGIQKSTYTELQEISELFFPPVKQLRNDTDVNDVQEHRQFTDTNYWNKNVGTVDDAELATLLGVSTG